MRAYVVSSARISPCNKYRYDLVRAWGKGFEIADYIAFIGLNPSTADANVDDATIRRCVDYAATWGADGLVMLNLFAYRSTNPRRLYNQDDPVGPLNDDILLSWARKAAVVVAAWGTKGVIMGRGAQMRAMLCSNRVDAYHLGLSKHGDPLHPLYLKKGIEPTLWA